MNSSGVSFQSSSENTSRSSHPSNTPASSAPIGARARAPRARCAEHGRRRERCGPADSGADRVDARSGIEGLAEIREREDGPDPRAAHGRAKAGGAEEREEFGVRRTRELALVDADP